MTDVGSNSEDRRAKHKPRTTREVFFVSVPFACKGSLVTDS